MDRWKPRQYRIRNVSIPPGTYRLGPADGTLSVRTGRTGAAAMAGHNLLFHVATWEATLAVGADPAATTLELQADGGSLRVIEGTGGMQALGDDDKVDIQKTIDDDVLKKQGVTFRSTAVTPSADGGLSVQGDLTLRGNAHPLTFDVTFDGQRLGGAAVIKQSDWKIKPYSALFGALKVVDEVEVSIDAPLPAAQSV
jgi:polyisoprenoid-binding protein YceI